MILSVSVALVHEANTQVSCEMCLKTGQNLLCSILLIPLHSLFFSLLCFTPQPSTIFCSLVFCFTQLCSKQTTFLVWDCVGGTTGEEPKWVSNSWFWDSSITDMSYFFEPVWVGERITVTEMNLGPKWLANFFMGPSISLMSPPAFNKMFLPKTLKVSCWLFTQSQSKL